MLLLLSVGINSAFISTPPFFKVRIQNYGENGASLMMKKKGKMENISRGMIFLLTLLKNITFKFHFPLLSLTAKT